MQFEKVSRQQFIDSFDFIHYVPETTLIDMYNNIKLPERSTRGSVGYDFFAPFGFKLFRGNNILIPTGIRAVDMDPDVGLFIFPRSGQGFKLRFALANTVGIIDSDYMNANNEGHIMVKLSYDGIKRSVTLLNINEKTLFIDSISSDDINPDRQSTVVNAGDKFCQGVFINCSFIGNEKEVTNERTGGMGSTDNK